MISIYEYKPVLDYLKKIGYNDAVIHTLNLALDNRRQRLDKLADLIRPFAQYLTANSASSWPLVSSSGGSTVWPMPVLDNSHDHTVSPSQDFEIQCHKDSNMDYFIPIVALLKEWPCEESAISISRLAVSMKLAYETDGLVVSACIQSLASIGTMDGINGLGSIINSIDREDLRIAAVNAIARIGGDDAKALLLKQINDSNENIKTAVQNAISRIERGDRSDAASSKPGETYTKNAGSSAKQTDTFKKPVTGAMIEQILDQIRNLEAKADNQSIQGIAAFLDNPEPRVRKQAVNSLGRLRATEAVDKLTALADNDPDAGVKQAAKFALLLIKK